MDGLCEVTARPPRHISRVNNHGHETENERDDEQGKIPPVRDLRIFVHQLRVDVVVVLSRGLEPVPDLLAVIQNSMGEDRAQRAQTLAVHDGEKCGDAHGRVLLVRGLIQDIFLRDNDASAIEFLAEDVVLACVVNRELLGLEAVGVIDSGDEDPAEEDKAGEHVSLCDPRDGERTGEPCGKCTPVQGEAEEAKTIQTTAKLGDEDGVAVGPAAQF
ncbi:hypothetical protein BC936DRAFT_140928 [Jimgerdemannia flammicorona]|uniref:Uncharacterized protein n=1 Tax=Jimgerdemannia flammicorona TaxID=994334 RepID=A0A433DGK8_9FUNG|nr:hypothetical protein BC936DRAFT_140928 [Jimgerdemannia flammicorona]